MKNRLRDPTGIQENPFGQYVLQHEEDTKAGRLRQFTPKPSSTLPPTIDDEFKEVTPRRRPISHEKDAVIFSPRQSAPEPGSGTSCWFGSQNRKECEVISKGKPHCNSSRVCSKLSQVPRDVDPTAEDGQQQIAGSRMFESQANSLRGEIRQRAQPSEGITETMKPSGQLEMYESEAEGKHDMLRSMLESLEKKEQNFAGCSENEQKKGFLRGYADMEFRAMLRTGDIYDDGRRNGGVQMEPNRPHDNGIHVLSNPKFVARHEILHNSAINDNRRIINNSESVRPFGHHIPRNKRNLIAAKPTRLDLLRQKQMLRHLEEEQSRCPSARLYSAAHACSTLSRENSGAGHTLSSGNSSLMVEKQSENFPRQPDDLESVQSNWHHVGESFAVNPTRFELIKQKKKLQRWEGNRSTGTAYRSHSAVHTLNTVPHYYHNTGFNASLGRLSFPSEEMSEMSTGIGISTHRPDEKPNLRRGSGREENKHTRNHCIPVRRIRRRKSRYNDEDLISPRQPKSEATAEVPPHCW